MMHIMILLIGDISCFTWNKLTIHRMLKVNTVLCQAHLDLVLHVVGSASQCCAVTSYDLMYNAPFHCVSCVWFVPEHQFLEVVPQIEIRRG